MTLAYLNGLFLHFIAEANQPCANLPNISSQDSRGMLRCAVPSTRHLVASALVGLAASLVVLSAAQSVVPKPAPLDPMTNDRVAHYDWVRPEADCERRTAMTVPWGGAEASAVWLPVSED